MLLKIKNLSFGYKQQNILQDISFDLESGEVLALLGANGAGKSTLLKCINRILQPGSGDIMLNDKNVFEMNSTALARIISYVPQYNENNSLSVFETVLLGRKPYLKWDITDHDLRVANDIIKLLGIEKLSMRNTNELSGGERQKVAIARALTQEPHLVLLDEPTSSLDPKNQIEILKIIQEAVKKKNVSAIISVHDLNMALRYADRFLLLSENRVYASISKDELTSEMIKEVYGIDVIIKEFEKYKTVILT